MSTRCFYTHMPIYSDYGLHNSEAKANTLTSLFRPVSVQYYITNPALLGLLAKHTRRGLRQLRSWLTFTSTISATETQAQQIQQLQAQG